MLLLLVISSLIFHLMRDGICCHFGRVKRKYRKICDIWHLRDQWVAGYHNFPEIRTL